MALFDILSGGSDLPQTPEPAGAASPLAPVAGYEELLTLLNEYFDRLKKQKARPTGGVEGSTLLNLCFLNDEQYTTYQNKTLSLEPTEENKLRLSFNLIAPRYNKLMGRLTAFNAPF